MSKLASHRLLEPGVYLEEEGLDFEDLLPGETYEHRPGKTFTAGESVRHALRALDQSPRLTDHRVNAALHGGRLVIDEVFVLGTVTALTTKTFDRVVANLGWKDIRFPHPVYDGDTVYAESTILDARASGSRPTQGILRVATRALNQEGTLVCSYERTLLVYRRGHGPYQAAGY